MNTTRRTWRWLPILASLVMLTACGRNESASAALVFDGKRGCVISLPESPSPAEQRAAKLIQLTLASAAGRPAKDFPIRTGGEAAGVGIHVAGSNHRKPGEPRLEEKVTWRVADGRVEISSYPADAIEAAAAWFLRETLGARWFMPGELGAHVPARKELRLASGERAQAPSYISRNLGLGGSSPEERDWWGRNRLRAWFQHTHAMNGLFTPDDVARNPDFASLVNGAKYFPTKDEQNWQPNIAAEGAAEHAAAVLRRRREFSSAIGMNDSIRFDQSERTRELLGEPRWFRHRPDYSKLVFRFVNGVAKRVPGRYLGAYAYDWTEDTPGFPMERNVVPYLTADRSEWFDPAFVESDQALIKRWVASGAEVVGLYDYYYGAPFLVPRPTLYAVAQAIPFAHQAGVRAFYAEVYPNWGLDGPKAWLAAELLWDATAKPEDLLAIYYRDFWREASGPMREYFALCDQQWLTQPKPSYWIKYYKDEHQHLLFPAEVRQKLQSLLAAAKTAATTELTRRRVEFFTRAFAVTDAFCAWEEVKDRLSRAALPQVPDHDALLDTWRELNEREAHLKDTVSRVATTAPLAVKATILGEYDRNDPRLRAAWRLAGAKLLPSAGEPLLAPGVPSLGGFTGKELLHDTALEELRIKPPTGSTDLEWGSAGAWRGHGEPYETRRIRLEKSAGAGMKPGAASLTMRGCKQETLSQFAPAEPGGWYAARVMVRGRVSPGNMTYLMLNFQDASRRTLGLGVVDRLPVGDYPEGVELVVWMQAPTGTQWVGMGVRALNQVGTDYAAFSGFSLQALAP